MNKSFQIALTLSDTATLLNISRPTMTQLARRSDFPAIKIGTRWVISIEGLQKWLDEQVEKKRQREIGIE